MGKKIKNLGSSAVNIATLGLVGKGPIPNILAGPEAAKSEPATSVTAPAAAPTMADVDVQAAREAARKRQAMMAGQGGTVLTAPGGLSGTAGGKTVLGG